MELLIDGLENLQVSVDQMIEYAGDCKKWLFTGEIGAGKTTFIQAVCHTLGVEEKVTSPTFSLINEYVYTNNKGESGLIHHIDLYRLKSLEEAIDIGIEDYLYDENYCFIEWPQLIQAIWPEPVIEINLEIIENSVRKIIFL